jgi:transcriptional regulator with XRE-family HTH domain
MSMQPMNAERYEFDAADRIRRAMRIADVGVTELARALDVNRNTVGNWINGHTIPRRRDLMAIAMRTGFPLAWLETGEAPNGETPPTGGGVSGGSLPGLDSNQEPAG